MFQSFVIVLREGFEAFLIVAITLTHLRKAGCAWLARVRLSEVKSLWRTFVVVDAPGMNIPEFRVLLSFALPVRRTVMF